MDLSIIIVSWNVKELLSRLLDSIFQYTEGISYEIIVIDNDSRDGTIDFLKTQYREQISSQQLKLIENKFNAGFAKANNQGLKIASGEFIAFMNPDMELLENSFEKTMLAIKQSPNVGVVTARLLYADKSLQPNLKSFPTLASQILVLLKLHHFFFWLPVLRKYFLKNINYAEYNYVDQVMGAFIFTRKEIIEKIGGWDEDYWLWWEDVELCRRIKDLNYDILYIPTTEIIHYEGKSFEQTSGLRKQLRFNRGLLTYFEKHHSKFSVIILHIFLPISLFLSILTKLFHIRPRPQSRV